MAVPRAMMGAFVGDAVGAVLEFSDGPISEARVRAAMAYPGGGPHRVGKAQTTDDSDLTLALWRALCSGEPRPQAMMRSYADWLYSVPFDIGATCHNAFDVFLDWKNGSAPEEECTPLRLYLCEDTRYGHNVSKFMLNRVNEDRMVALLMIFFYNQFVSYGHFDVYICIRFHRNRILISSS